VLKVEFLGIDLPVTVSELDFALVVLCLYAIARSYYVGSVQATPPWRIRQALRSGRVPLAVFEGKPELRGVQLAQNISAYYPHIDQEGVRVEPPGGGAISLTNQYPPLSTYTVVLPPRSFQTHIWCLYENFYYMLPMLLTISALVWLVLAIYFGPEPKPVKIGHG